MKASPLLAVILCTFAQHTLAAVFDSHYDIRANEARGAADDLHRLAARQDGDPTSTGPAPPAVATPILAFPAITGMTACTSTLIRWRYYGPLDADMSLSITNHNVPQMSTSPEATSAVTFEARAPPLVSDSENTPAPSGGLGESGPGRIFAMIAPGILGSAFNYTWESVAVPQGYYMLVANFPGWDQTFRSTAFLVRNGTDMSCLVTAPPSSTTSSSTGASSTESSTSTSSSSSTALPVSAAGVNKGAIAGGVIGGVAIIAAAIAAFLFIRYASANRRRGGGLGGNTSGMGLMGAWGNLGSFDSTARSGAVKTSKPKPKVYGGKTGVLAGLGIGAAAAATDSKTTRSHHSQRHNSNAESLGPILGLQLDAVPYRNKGAISEEDMNHTYSPFDEKYHTNGGVSDNGHDDDAYGAPILALDANTDRQTSSSSSNTQRQRHGSQSGQSGQSGGSGSPNAGYLSSSSVDVYPPPSPAYPSGTSGYAYNSSPKVALSPLTAPGPLPGASPTTPARRTPRKPVPSYNPEDPTLVFSIPDVPTDIRDSDIPVIPHLTHKGSQGSFRQMHYLIPDPPPPQKS